MQLAWDEAVRGIQRSFADGFDAIFRDGFSGFEDFASSVVGIFRRLAAEIAAAFVTEALGIPQLIQQIRAGVDVRDLTGTAAGVLRYGGAAAIGIGVGAGTGNPLLGALGGGAAGAALAGPVGAVVGAVGGLVSGLWSSARRAQDAAEAARQAAREMELAVDAWRESVSRAFAVGPRDPLAERFRDAVVDRYALLPEDLRFEADRTGILDLDNPAAIAARADEILNPPPGHAVPRAGPLRDFFEDIVEAYDEFLVAAAERERDLNEALEVRALRAVGRDDEAARLAQDIEQEEELAQARAFGYSEETIARIKAVHAMEDEALVREQSADAIRDVTSALNAPSGLRISLLRWRADVENAVGDLPGAPDDPLLPFPGYRPPIPGQPDPIEPPDPIVDPLPPRPPDGLDPIGRGPAVPDPRIDPVPPEHGGLSPITMNIQRIDLLVRSNGQESEIELARKVRRGLAEIGLRGGGDPTNITTR